MPFPFPARIPAFESARQPLEKLFGLAVENVFATNTVACPLERYNKTGLLSGSPCLMIRAGAQYASPWTRDASVNAWNCASLFAPEVAENTLWAVCERDEEGRLVLQRDDQFWDKIIWAAGAWNHYLVAGSHTFAQRAYETIANTLAVCEETRFNDRFGLFTGGSFFNDGISGYPADLHEPGNGSSFVNDHPLTRTVMAFSTNCLYSRAYSIAARLAEVCGDEKSAAPYRRKSEAVRAAVNRHFRDEARGSYGYLLYPDGRKCFMQEAAGLSFALLFDICGRAQAERLFESIRYSPCGLASVVPPFSGLFSETHPGRHNNLIWPFLNGFFITAAARYGKADLVGAELDRMAALFERSDGEFYEIYNPCTGAPDGGWQVGKHWGSCHHQTWSASAYIRSILHGLFGIELCEEGLRFSPCLPAGRGDISLKGLRLRDLAVDVSVSGSGAAVRTVRVNGLAQEQAFLPFCESGAFQVDITLGDV